MRWIGVNGENTAAKVILESTFPSSKTTNMTYDVIDLDPSTEIPLSVRKDNVAAWIAAMTSILVDCFNCQASDAVKCQKLGEYVAREIIALAACGKLSEAFYVHTALQDVIWEYGEPIDESYCGRDEDGEKRFIIHNPDTNWSDRISSVYRPLLKVAGIG